ncbi:major capsid protein [Sigmofec virus UA08Rod_6219]|uniref:Major capsid protein n=1 Tax=Sigmofec virus UA08Rod_6219 TaxID=2929225 RepID=A0A976N0C1_9VIRU|nr:major capsid protein [Sigmofec virus UA08Rod_6219]
MNGSYSQGSLGYNEAHFSQAAFGEVEHSRMQPTCDVLTTFNAGDIVPVLCWEALPNSSVSVSVDFTIRQNTILTPTMGRMFCDIYGFFVPNRIVNQSFKSIMGENVNGTWTATPISLAPLYDPEISGAVSRAIPVGSIADYYGYATQGIIPGSVLSLCHDLKIRGYIEIYNQFFRDQNYQPPIAYSKLNVYESFFYYIGSNSSADTVTVVPSTDYDDTLLQDNSVGAGAVGQAIYGNLIANNNPTGTRICVELASVFDACAAPLKANKLHDYFTSVLPSSQKSAQLFVPVNSQEAAWHVFASAAVPNTYVPPEFAEMKFVTPTALTNGALPLYAVNVPGSSDPSTVKGLGVGSSAASGYSTPLITPQNLIVDPSAAGLSIEDIRMTAALQQVYEALARGGSRYRSYIKNFFGLDVSNPFDDIPTRCGRIRRELDLYQTAQTSPSQGGSTPQGNLAAFGYTHSAGNLFHHTAFEHGYYHVFAIVRHRNIYSSYFGRDNFRTSFLDFYHPQLATISEQPVYTREINPIGASTDETIASQVFGYQEAYAEYRYFPDRVSGYMRPGISGSLALWNYADDYDSSLKIADGSWLESNSAEVLDRSLAVTSSVAHQFKGQFRFTFDLDLPMPTYSVPGLDYV